MSLSHDLVKNLVAQTRQTALMGGPLKRVRRKVKRAAKKVKKHDFTKDITVMNKAAKVVGPALMTAMPQYAPYIQSGMAILDGVDKLNQGDISKIEAIQAGVAAGDPEAVKAASFLQVADTMRRQVSASDLLTMAMSGDPSAIQQIQAIAKGAQAGNADAKASLEALTQAKKGLDIVVKPA